MKVILRTEGLTKRFGELLAVDNIDLQVHEGDIYGFLGLNGAGKTTTIRLILNLIKPTSGRVYIFGYPLRKNPTRIMGELGALIEIPTFYNYLSGYQNLEVLRLAHRGISKKRIDEVLDIVGLGPRRHTRVGTYSQGMRQRLGIAQALLSRPRFMIMDEPTNGLDPQGMHEVRQLILRLHRQEGTTFFISTHLLHEVEMICNRVGIINRGRLILQQDLSSILREGSDAVRIYAFPTEQAFRILTRLPYVYEVTRQQDGFFHVRSPLAEHGKVVASLVLAGVEVREFSPVKVSLEQTFLRYMEQ
jgi:ABC-2 type transport system ATP-binding protein